jgi:hypothetical protein
MNVAELIREADRDDRIWALLVEHEDGALEAHSHEGATAVFARNATEAAYREWLLVPEPIACDEALAAGVDVLNDCDRCS